MSLPTTTTAAAAPRDAHSKALALNLDPSKYGSFAEIGAGQEVARWFLTVGAASGTVAQTISAYDKTFSDDTYGAGSRYVSRERLLAMLDHEYGLLLGRLAATRGATSRFFAFADTVAARNHRGDNEQHGWVGIRFQAEPGAAHSDVLVHVNLMDTSAQRQQEALGFLGVNLVYASFHQCGSAGEFLGGLFDDLSIDRVEIDVVELAGPAFAGVDGRAWCLQALRRGMAHAVVFDRRGQVVEPSSALRKRPLIVERGRFESVEPFQGAMLRAAERRLREEGVAVDRDPIPVLEMTLRHVHDGASEGVDDDVLLARVERLRELGSVVVSDFDLTYLLTQYLRRHTLEPIRLVGGVSTLARLLAERFYAELPGELLEGIGKLLATNVKIYVYAMPREAYLEAMAAARMPAPARLPERVTASDVPMKPPLDHLYRYLCESDRIVPLGDSDSTGAR